MSDSAMARFRNAVLDAVVAYGSSMTGAVFSGAVLRNARLHGVDLNGADLSSADLTGAVLLEVSLIGYMNSSGIGLLVTLLIRANRQKQRLLAVGLTEHYRQIFELTRLNEAIGIHDDEKVALAAVTG